MEDHVVGVLLLPPVAEVVVAEHPAEDELFRAVDIGGAGDDFGLLRPVLEMVQPDACFVERLEDGLDGLRILLGELGREGADLFRMILPDLLGVKRRESDPIRDRASVPRLTHAESVHLPDLHIRDHLGGRDRDQRDVFIGMDAARRQVVAHPHRVRSRRIGHREGHGASLRLGFVHERLERFGVVRHFSLEVGLERDALAVPVEHPGNDHGSPGRTQETHGRGYGHAGQHVGRLDVSVGEGVSNGRPARSLADRRVDPVLLEETPFVRDHDRRTVGDRDHAELEVPDLGTFGRAARSREWTRGSGPFRL